MISEESGTPWLNYDFELIEKPSPIIGLFYIYMDFILSK